MPPQVSFTKERVLQQAFEIVRKEGIGALSARKIAQHLHCSTRPVYTAFQSMEALREEVIQYSQEFALRYFLQNSENGDSPFLHLGLQYFRFSQEEKELFNLLYVEGNIGITLEKIGQPFAQLLDQMKRDPLLTRLSEASMKRLGGNMWIYTHGLIVLSSKEPPQNAEEIVRNNLRQMGEILINWETALLQENAEENGESS